MLSEFIYNKSGDKNTARELFQQEELDPEDLDFCEMPPEARES